MLTREQRENRKKGIGASECAVVMGFDPAMSPYELWQIKTGRLDPREEELDTLTPVYWGKQLESVIADEYAKRMRCDLDLCPDTMFHDEHAHLLCHPDRLVKGEKKLLECKFAMYARGEWGPSGSDEVPMEYILQVQHQLLVTGYEAADLAVLISGFDFRIYHFKRDEELISKIVAELNEFWQCVETDTPPPLRDRRDAQLAYPFSVPNAKQAEPEVIEVVNKINELKAKTKELEKEKAVLESNLAIFMKDAEALITDKAVLATWKSNKNGTRVLRINGGQYE